jgi:hypothetical protein
VKGAPFRPIGGAVIADHGPIALVAARELARFYALEALHWRAHDGQGAFHACARRAIVLRDAVAAAEAWRRAAGWRNPDAADARLTGAE